MTIHATIDRVVEHIPRLGIGKPSFWNRPLFTGSDFPSFDLRVLYRCAAAGSEALGDTPMASYQALLPILREQFGADITVTLA